MKFSLDSIYELIACQVFHLRKCEPLLSQILERGSYMIDLVVDKQETVVSLVEALDGYWSILGIVLVYVQL